ncbi:iron-containing alcohol dehydrogenase [Leucobacter chromiisoli]|nr:iron-containing alcohol dehydrogenase [Leucobacter chromiisoli]
MRVGGGAIAEVGELVRTLGARRPLVVTDAFMVSTGTAELVMGHLRESGLEPAVFSETVPDPTTASLEAGVEAVRSHDADAIVAVGGGSPIDTGKALAMLSAQGGAMRDYKAPRVNYGPALPVVAVPTTAGSGSEATQFSVITDSETNEKMLCAGPGFLPVAAILDFELTLSKPSRLTADTAVDAMCHAIEAYVSRKATPFTDSMAMSALRASSSCIREVYADGGDRAGREALMLASLQAGIAFSNASVTLIHGMSRPIGGNFRIAHGLSNAMLLPVVTGFSIGGAESRYADVARALGAATAATDDAVAARALVEWLRRLCSDLEVPSPASYGIERDAWEELIPTMARQAIDSGSPANNPILPTAEEIESLYVQAYDPQASDGTRT